QNFVIFTNPTQAQFAFGNPSVTFSTGNVASSGSVLVGPPAGLPSPSLFWSAHPGLVGQLQNLGSAQVQLQLSSGTMNTNLYSGTFDGTNIVFNLGNISSIQAITNAFNLAASGQQVSNCSGIISIPSKNPQFTIPISGNLTLTHQN
ncbi:MAG TPA: hypothetical protein VGN61_16500, partial [Verrucomicrobiae bacterium]